MAKINLKYSRRLDALVLKPGKRDTVSYRLVSRLASVRSPALLGIERSDPADEDAPFYYGVADLARLDAFLSRPLSLVQFRCMLESLRAVMELCVGEGLPQGNVCFDPACVFVDGSGAMRFAFVPFERVDGAGSALELLEYLSRRRVRMVLPQDEAVRDEVADFARSVSVLSAADFSAFLEARFGVHGGEGASGGGGALEERANVLYARGGGAPYDDRAALCEGVGDPCVWDGGTAPGEREQAFCVGDVSGTGDLARPALSVDPVALMAGRASERMVARSVADDLASLPHSGPLACVPETSELSRSRCGDRDEDGSATRPDSSSEGGSAPRPASSPGSSPERLSPRQVSGPAPQSAPGCKDDSAFVPESRWERFAPQPVPEFRLERPAPQSEAQREGASASCAAPRPEELAARPELQHASQRDDGAVLCPGAHSEQPSPKPVSGRMGGSATCPKPRPEQISPQAAPQREGVLTSHAARLPERPSLQPGQPSGRGPSHPAAPVARPILERVRDGARYALPEGPAVIGRSQTCDISIAGNGALSRRHVCVDAKAGTIEDLGSANGTFVGGARLPAHRPEPLSADESFFLADEEFRLRAE